VASGDVAAKITNDTGLSIGEVLVSPADAEAGTIISIGPLADPTTEFPVADATGNAQVRVVTIVGGGTFLEFNFGYGGTDIPDLFDTSKKYDIIIAEH
jgi:hypothetical protein